MPFACGGDILTPDLIRELAPDVRRPGGRLVFLSPHLDDAVLSCGGLINRQVEQGRPILVITCFAGTPDYGVLSQFAAEQHQRWGQPDDPVAYRRQEDVAAVTSLGAEHLHLDYLDCIYRRHPSNGEFLYASETALFNGLHVCDDTLVDEVAMQLAAVLPPEASQLCVPLSVGNHVDHQVILQAASQLDGGQFSLWHYEDYPYAQVPGALARALAEWASAPTAFLQPLAEAGLSAKISAILCYRSQLQVLFGGETRVESKVRSYALYLGTGTRYAERYWLDGVA